MGRKAVPHDSKSDLPLIGHKTKWNTSYLFFFQSGDNPPPPSNEEFMKFDKDGNGFISKREFRRATRALNKGLEDPEKITRKQLNEAFKILDENNDRKLDFDEFKKLPQISRKRHPILVLIILCIWLCPQLAY